MEQETVFVIMLKNKETGFLEKELGSLNINKNDELVLVDYKTDYVPENDETSLKDKYTSQLEIYKRALEQALNRKVDSIYIYSTYLGKEIKM